MSKSSKLKSRRTINNTKQDDPSLGPRRAVLRVNEREVGLIRAFCYYTLRQSSAQIEQLNQKLLAARELGEDDKTVELLQKRQQEAHGVFVEAKSLLEKVDDLFDYKAKAKLVAEKMKAAQEAAAAAEVMAKADKTTETEAAEESHERGEAKAEEGQEADVAGASVHTGSPVVGEATENREVPGIEETGPERQGSGDNENDRQSS